MTTSDPRDVLARIKQRHEYAESVQDGLDAIGAMCNSYADVPRLAEALEAVLYELDSIEADLDRGVYDLIPAGPTALDHATRQGFSVIRAERAVVGRVRRAITTKLNEEEA